MSSLDLNKENENLAEVPATEAIDTTITSDVTETAVTEVTEIIPEVPTKTDYTAYGRQQLVDALKLLVDGEVEQIKEDVESIKQLFYKKQKSELEEQKKLFIENGGIEADFIAETDNLETVLKSLLNDYKTRKSAHIAKIEQEKEQNMLQKQHILEQMKGLSKVMTMFRRILLNLRICNRNGNRLEMCPLRLLLSFGNNTIHIRKNFGI